MKKIRTILIILSIFVSANIYSQLSCGTPTNEVIQNFPSGDTGFSINSTPICVNVQFHIVRATDGTGGATTTNTDQIINLLNNHLNPHNVFVNKVGIDYINNSTYYDMNSNNNSTVSFNGLTVVNTNQNAINFYIINTNTTWIGRAQGIPSKSLVMTKAYITSGVSVHEFGHCLNLVHTFHPVLFHQKQLYLQSFFQAYEAASFAYARLYMCLYSYSLLIFLLVPVKRYLR